MDPDEQLLLTLNTGTPVRPRPEREGVTVILYQDRRKIHAPRSEREKGVNCDVEGSIVRLRHEERRSYTSRPGERRG